MTLNLSKDDVNALQVMLYSLIVNFECDAKNMQNSWHKRHMAKKSAKLWSDLLDKVKEQADKQGGAAR